MDAQNLPKGQSPLKNGDGKNTNLPGIYIHKTSGAKLITAPGRFGVSQADALMTPLWHGEWERVGDVPTGQELLKMRQEQEQKDKNDDPNVVIDLNKK
jgi:hypothetical protein